MLSPRGEARKRKSEESVCRSSLFVRTYNGGELANSRRRWVEPNLADTDVVRQHVVPRFWLRHFTLGGRIDAFEVKTGVTFTTSVENVAVQARFYDVAKGRRHLSTESWLADLEAEAAPIMRLLIEDPSRLLDLGPSEENTFARFLCAQFMRVPTRRNYETTLRETTVDWVKDFARKYTDKELGEEESAELWKFWDRKPDEFFLREEEPYQPAATTASMLGQVQGFGNILKAMPWRIGRVSEYPLYLSDNPVSRFPLPTRRFPSFADHVYFIPLNPKTMLRIGHGIGSSRRGTRTVRDFNAWQTSFARHVVTTDSDKYLFGQGPYVDEQCAVSCMDRLRMVIAMDGYVLQGLDPRKP